MKKVVCMILAAMMVLAGAALADAVEMERVQYEGNGRVEVDFFRDVTYGDLAISVEDSQGNAYEISILERDDDDLTFRVEGIQAGETYAFTISGVKAGRSGEFGSVTGAFSTPEEGAVGIESVEYDADDREVEIDFIGSVEFDMNCFASVTDAAGNEYPSKIVKMKLDSLELSVEGLVRGEHYTVLVSGVKNAGEAEFGAVSWEFQAIDD